MHKKILCLLLLAGLLLTGYGAAEEPGTLRLVVASDVHFTLQPNSSIYPLMSRIEDVMNTLADEVIALQPDAFLLCGDNTNRGREKDMQALAAILHRVQNAGIPVIVVPGNHDFDLSDRERFAETYTNLCETEEFDPASLSRMLHIGFLRILVMDDSSYSKGSAGRFSDATMGWLQEQLKEAEEVGEVVLFLSHHNVLPGGEAAENSTYMIQNVELRDLLSEYGVALCFSGHRHSQEILSSGGLYEIVSSMPAISPHLMGIVTIEGSSLSYRAEPIDFSTFGYPYGLQSVSEWERENAGSARIPVENLSRWELCSREEKEAVNRLFRLYMEGYGNGAIAEVKEQILADPWCELFLDLFDDTNYGPWMRAVLASDPLPGNRLELSLSDYG